MLKVLSQPNLISLLPAWHISYFFFSCHPVKTVVHAHGVRLIYAYFNNSFQLSMMAMSFPNDVIKTMQSLFYAHAL